MNIRRLNEEIEQALDKNVREWEFNGNQFKEIIVDKKEVEIIPGYTITYNKIGNYKNGQLNRTTWEAARSTDSAAINQRIQMEVVKKLGIEGFVRIGSSSGAVPLIITI